jgi:tRNA(Ile2) C34 agmatinyltransferase TiaS
VDDERAPICPVCGVTMVPGSLSAGEASADWICVECEETGEDETF